MRKQTIILPMGHTSFDVSVPLRGLDMRKPVNSNVVMPKLDGFSPLAGIRYAETQHGSHYDLIMFQSPCGD